MSAGASDNEVRDGLPAPVARFLEVAYPQGIPKVSPTSIETRGRFRRRPLPWLPVRIRIFLRPGIARVSDLHVRLGPVTVLKVLDAYVDGRGITQVLNSADTGPKIDQGSLHPVLAETLFFPGAWSLVPGLRWEPINDRSAHLVVPYQDDEEVATVRFDPATGMPSSYEVPRYKAQGPKVDWKIEMRHWQRIGSAQVPGCIAVSWTDEPGPWLTMDIVGMTVGVDVEEAFTRARRAIAVATARSET